MRDSKRYAVGAGVLAAVLLLAAAPWSEARGRGRRGPRGDGGLVARLDLTQEQQQQIGQLRATFRKEQIQRRAALQVARMELQELMSAPKLDTAAIKAKAREISEQSATQVRARLEHHLAVAQILTPEQRAQASQMWGQGHRGRRGPGWPAEGDGWGQGRRHRRFWD